MVIEAGNNTYISLHDVFTRYMGSLTKDIMNHMMARYGRITVVYI